MPAASQKRVAGLEAKMTELLEGIKRFYVAQGSHLPPSWREHFEELLRDETPFLGLLSR